MEGEESSAVRNGKDCGESSRIKWNWKGLEKAIIEN
jgi:hypothetical protein